MYSFMKLQLIDMEELLSLTPDKIIISPGRDEEECFLYLVNRRTSNAHTGTDNNAHPKQA